MNKNITVKQTLIKPLFSIKSINPKINKINKFLDVYFELKITPEYYSTTVKGI
jgi:hypothetical protein